MTDSEIRSSKRSRFDQTEPEAKRASRFDRRSRSPPNLQSDSRRSRSPVGKRDGSPTSGAKSPQDAASAAAAAAARINASIQAKKGIQHVDVPPIRATSSPSNDPRSPSTTSGTKNVSGDIYIAEGDYIKDIEVNDLRNRYTLTKGPTQKMIKEETGADVTTRGNYYPDKSKATPTNPPLYLHITSQTKEGLEKAVAKIDELMQQELPNLVDERRFRRRDTETFERDELGRRKWPEERISIDIEQIPGFNLRAQVVGQGGAYVKHIQGETRCRVQIKGRGSGYLERGTDQESDEAMYLHVTGPDPREVERAKELCEDLLGNVKQQWQQFRDNPPQRNYGGERGGYNQRDQSGTAYGGYGGYGNSNNGGGGSYGGYGAGSSYQSSYAGANYGSAQSPPGAATSPAPGATAAPGAAGGQGDAAAQWAQYYAMYPEAAQYYYQQMMQQQQQPQQQPPPSSEAPPPPPPPSGSPPPANGGYNAVPPPPGM